jgi:GcrA cell cycle regulator
MDIIWTDDRIEQLTKLWAKGLSCRKIADEMGCFSHCFDGGRSAVIGKIHRLKLKDPVGKQESVGLHRAQRSEPSRRKVTAKPQQRRNPSRNVLAAIAIAAAEPCLPERLKGAVPDGTGIKLHELTKLTCRFPIGDPRDPDFEYCGARALKGLPYCAGHAALAYRDDNRST